MAQEQNPYQSPHADQEPNPSIESGQGGLDSFARRKRKYLIFLIVWSMVAGLVFGAAPVEWEPILILLDAIVFLIAIIQWTFVDAAQHKFRLWRHFVLLMVICPGPLVMMPYYFFSTRGGVGGLKASALAFGFLMLLYAIDFASSFVAAALVWGI